MFKIIFVCTGNTCRSPMAEYLFRKIINEDLKLKDKWQVESAGIAVLPAQTANQNALKALEEEDLDLSQHYSRQLDKKLISKAEIILTMTERHKEAIKEIRPNFNKVFTLKEFAGENNNLDILDPYGQSLAVYQKTKNEIKEHLQKLVAKLRNYPIKAGNLAERENYITRGENKVKIAIASDHAGLELKNEIISLLKKAGYEYFDYGPNTRDSVDYPDFAIKVAQAVSKGDYQRGILICGTGIGMAIAANKVKGIRAALCHDLFSTKATREHNDSNVLTLGARVIGSGLAEEIVKTWLKTEFTGDRHQKRIDKIIEIEGGD